MNALSSNDFLDKIMDYLIKLLEKEVDKSTQTDVSKLIGVAPSTIGRWIRGDRGERLTLAHSLRIITKLGGSMADLADHLGYPDVAKLLKAKNADPELIAKFIDLIDDSGIETDQLKNQIQFLWEIKHSK
jgi:DNA-binding XRE family transcriptional regulator